MRLSKDEIKHIANLARLELTDKEIEIYQNQLSGIFSFIDQLKEVDTEMIDPTAQVTGLENVYREDEIVDWNKYEVEKAIKEAPELKDNQYKVKKVL